MLKRMLIIKSLLVLLISFGYTHIALAELLVIPIVKNALGKGCFTFKGLTYCELESPTTQRVWLDRNLGARRACVAEWETDKDCFGDYFQWGADGNGHEYNSNTETNLYDSLSYQGYQYIVGSEDWVEQGVDDDGSLRAVSWNPCPTGYRVPTITELEAENFADRFDAFAKLKLPVAGFREFDLLGEGVDYNLQYQYGYIWSSTPADGSNAWVIEIDVGNSNSYAIYRSFGYPVRCIKE